MSQPLLYAPPSEDSKARTPSVWGGFASIARTAGIPAHRSRNSRLLDAPKGPSRPRRMRQAPMRDAHVATASRAATTLTPIQIS